MHVACMGEIKTVYEILVTNLKREDHLDMYALSMYICCRLQAFFSKKLDILLRIFQCETSYNSEAIV